MVAVVFGARGNVGRHVAAGLRDVGVPVRTTSRYPGAADVVADLERPGTLAGALDGADRVFTYAKPDGVDGFVAAARTAGVRHVVLLSSAAVVHPGAENNPIARAHRTVEQAIARSGIAWTFVRAGMFAANVLWWWAEPIRTEGRVRVPYPQAQTAPVHERDLADLAVAALTGPGHQGQAYTAYGPESLTLRQQVEQIGAAIGRGIACETVSVERARTEMGRSMPPVVVEAVLRLWSDPKPAPTSDRPGRTFAQWARDHADDFR